MDNHRKIVEQIDQMIAGSVICGASYGFLEQGEVSCYYRGVQGKTEPYADRPLAEGMYYDLASLSKVIGTTTAVLQLVDEGKLAFDTPVTDTLPRFAIPGITVGQLLLHCGGLPAEIRDKENWSRENITEFLYTTKPEAEPGTSFLYSDVGFILLGKIVEQIDQTGLEESYQRRIFGPLSMDHTSFLTGGKPELYIPTECTAARGCICGQVHDKKAYLMGPCGSAGLFSTLSDVVRFAGAYLTGSSFLFGTDTFRNLVSTDVFGRTYGWSVEYGPGTLYHTGFTGTSLLLDRNRGRGFVLLTNRIHPVRENETFLRQRKQLNRLFLERDSF